MEERAGDKMLFQQRNFPIYSLVFLFSVLISFGGKTTLEEQIKKQSTNDFMPTTLVNHNLSCKSDKGQ